MSTETLEPCRPPTIRTVQSDHRTSSTRKQEQRLLHLKHQHLQLVFVCLFVFLTLCLQPNSPVILQKLFYFWFSFWAGLSGRAASAWCRRTGDRAAWSLWKKHATLNHFNILRCFYFLFFYKLCQWFTSYQKISLAVQYQLILMWSHVDQTEVCFIFVSFFSWFPFF